MNRHQIDMKIIQPAKQRLGQRQPDRIAADPRHFAVKPTVKQTEPGGVGQRSLLFSHNIL